MQEERIFLACRNNLDFFSDKDSGAQSNRCFTQYYIADSEELLLYFIDKNEKKYYFLNVRGNSEKVV